MTLTLPHNLTRGTIADAQDIQDNDEYVRDALDDYHATYKTALYATGHLLSTQTAATRFVNIMGAAVASGSVSGSYIPAMIYIGSEAFDVLGYDRKFRLSVAVSTGAVNPTGNVTFGLYLVTGFSSTTGSLGLTTGGGTTYANDVVVAMAAGLESVSVGTDFTISTPGLFALTMSNSATLAANSMVMAGIALQYRNV